MMTKSTDTNDGDATHRPISKWDVVVAWAVLAVTLAGLAIAG